MKIRCITCAGRGSVDKKYPEGVITWKSESLFGYSHLINGCTGERIGMPSDGRDIWPQEPCLTCDSTGWIDRETANFILAVRARNE